MTGIGYSYGKPKSEMSREHAQIRERLETCDLSLAEVIPLVGRIFIDLDAPEYRALLRHGETAFRIGDRDGTTVEIRLKADVDPTDEAKRVFERDDGEP